MTLRRTEEQTNGGDPSPFHPGEQRIQSALGIREKMEAVGRRILRPHLVDQHRAFFEELPMVYIAGQDDQQRPWLSMRWGRPGFMNSSDPGHLEVGGSGPPGDPIEDLLGVSAQVGMLGLMFENRRRNRLNGQVESRQADGRFTVTVDHSFGNCPKYIQSRNWRWHKRDGDPNVSEGAKFAPDQSVSIASADTFFIASSARPADRSAAGAHQEAAFGLDVSHRGGAPGFVRIIDERTFEFPDYSGNFMFNTLGNLLVNPHSAYLFPDFANGDLIQCRGTTEILWEEHHRERFPGAQRVLRFKLERIRHTRGVLPFAWSAPEMSPHLP